MWWCSWCYTLTLSRTSRLRGFIPHVAHAARSFPVCTWAVDVTVILEPAIAAEVKRGYELVAPPSRIRGYKLCSPLACDWLTAASAKDDRVAIPITRDRSVVDTGRAERECEIGSAGRGGIPEEYARVGK